MKKMVLVGIDVSADDLVVAVKREGGALCSHGSSWIIADFSHPVFLAPVLEYSGTKESQLIGIVR